MCRLTLLAAFLTAACPVSAGLLYDLNFTPPEVGAYSIVFGNPTVQRSVGPFTDALVFDAVTSYEQIQLSIREISSSYTLEFDVLSHALRNSQYGFTILLDTPEVRTVGLHGGLNRIDVYQPSPYTIANVASFSDDTVYHFTLSVDLKTDTWSVAVDGEQVYTNLLHARELSSIRFSMSPWIGGAIDAPGTYVALDNVVVTGTPEPSTGGLLVAGTAAALLRRRRDCYGTRMPACANPVSAQP